MLLAIRKLRFNDIYIEQIPLSKNRKIVCQDYIAGRTLSDLAIAYHIPAHRVCAIIKETETEIFKYKEQIGESDCFSINGCKYRLRTASDSVRTDNRKVLRDGMKLLTSCGFADKDLSICQDYIAGITAGEISRRNNCSASNIRRIVHECAHFINRVEEIPTERAHR